MTVTRLESAHRAVLSAVLRAALATPAPLRRLAFGAPPRSDRGDPLDPIAHLLARLDELTQPGLSDPDVRVARDGMARGTALVARRRPADVGVAPLRLGGVPARLYRPAGVATPAPLVVFFHGGGWVLGDLETHDGLCGRIARELGVLVAAVDYRLAPEHPCPAAFEDAFAAFCAARDDDHGQGWDCARVAVAGDSAGGNLSAAVAMACRDAGRPGPAAQLLIYPATDLRRLTASHRTCAKGPMLTAEDIQFFLDCYAAPDLADPRVSPGAAAELAGLPPAVVTSAGFDPLRDEAEDYARRLVAAGVPTEHLHHPDLIHGYASMDAAVPAADAAVAAMLTAFARLWLGRGRAAT